MVGSWQMGLYRLDDANVYGHFPSAVCCDPSKNDQECAENAPLEGEHCTASFYGILWLLKFDMTVLILRCVYHVLGRVETLSPLTTPPSAVKTPSTPCLDRTNSSLCNLQFAILSFKDR